MVPDPEEEDEPDVTPPKEEDRIEDNRLVVLKDESVTPPEPTPPEPEPTPTLKTTSQTITQYKVDIKVVHWIPYRANDIPMLNRFLPTRWKNAATVAQMSQEARYAIRAMLSTGNAPPPNAFRDQASWKNFVDSKEYRAIFWAQLYICCPSGELQHDPKVKMHKAGFTPSLSNIKESPANTLEKRLKEYRDERHTPGSTIEGCIARGGVVKEIAMSAVGFPYIGEWSAPDQIDDPLAKLEEIYKDIIYIPQSYSQGKDFLFPPQSNNTEDCVAGTWSYFFRVGDSHNLLNHMLIGSLIPYQGGDMTFKLCCSTKKLSLKYNHTTVPSFKVYVNNVKAGKQYDMMKSQFSHMYDSISGSKLDSLKDDDNKSPSRPKLPPNNIWKTSVDIPGESDCKPIPDDWWPKPKGKLY